AGPLTEAVKRKDLRSSQALLDAGADPNLAYSFGLFGRSETPLGIAVSHDDSAAVKLLLERGADPNIITGSDYSRVLQIAKSAEIVEMLRRHGGNAKIRKSPRS